MSISVILPDCEKQVKVGKLPKVSDLQIACLYEILIHPSIQSYHLIKLIVDSTILRVANTYRAQTRKIKRVAGKKFWAKRKRNIYSWDYQRNVRFEEVHYGLLVIRRVKNSEKLEIS